MQNSPWTKKDQGAGDLEYQVSRGADEYEVSGGAGVPLLVRNPLHCRSVQFCMAVVAIQVSGGGGCLLTRGGRMRRKRGEEMERCCGVFFRHAQKGATSRRVERLSGSAGNRLSFYSYSYIQSASIWTRTAEKGEQSAVLESSSAFACKCMRSYAQTEVQ